MVPWKRLLLRCAEAYLRTLPEQDQQEGLRLIAEGKYKIRTEVHTEGPWEETGIRYVVDLLPDDGRVVEAANVHWRYVAELRLPPTASSVVPVNPATAATRVAIECLTLWMEEDRTEAAQRIVELAHGPDGPGADQMITGLLNLSMLLVLSLAKEQGAEDIGQRAAQILQELSPRLPE